MESIIYIKRQSISMIKNFPNNLAIYLDSGQELFYNFSADDRKAMYDKVVYSVIGYYADLYGHKFDCNTFISNGIIVPKIVAIGPVVACPYISPVQYFQFIVSLQGGYVQTFDFEFEDDAHKAQDSLCELVDWVSPVGSIFIYKHNS